MTRAQTNPLGRSTPSFLPSQDEIRSARMAVGEREPMQSVTRQMSATPQLHSAATPTAETPKRGTVDEVLIDDAIARSAMRQTHLKATLFGSKRIEILELDDFYTLRIRETRRFRWLGREREIHTSLHTTLASAWERLSDLVSSKIDAWR